MALCCGATEGLPRFDWVGILVGLLQPKGDILNARSNGSGKDTRGPAISRAPWCCCGCIHERRERGRGWERCGTVRRNGGISGIGTAATFRWCARFEVREDRLLPYPEGGVHRVDQGVPLDRRSRGLGGAKTPEARPRRLGENGCPAREPNSQQFAVVREPAQRLLSCFLQKCNQYNMENEYSNCPYLELWPDLFDRERFPDGVPTPRYEMPLVSRLGRSMLSEYGTRTHGHRRPDVDTLAVVWEAFTSRGRDSMFALYVDVITRRIKQDPCGQNKHWSPQYCHCSLDVTAPVFRIVGWANMTEVASAAIVPFASSPARGLEIKEFLVDRMDTNHERHGKKTSAGSRSQEAYTTEALQAVHEAYAKDYELFSQYWDENN